MSDRLADLAARLAELDEQPVRSHPDVLDELHRALVGELDALGRLTVSESRSG
jgi:hypothetical protein